MHKEHIVVIGAGYAGLIAALRLGGKARRAAQVTLVNASGVFVERIRLHQVAAQQRVKQHQLAAIAARRGVAFVQGYVTSIQLSTRTLTVHMVDGVQTIAYDTLVYALGSTIDRDRVPGVRDHGYVLTPDGDRGAAALAARLKSLPAGAAVTVAGGGLTGIETVTELAEAYPRLRFTLVTRGVVGETVSDGARAYLRRAMQRRNIQLIEHRGIVSADAARLVLEGGESLPHDALIWAGAFTVPPLAREAGLAVTPRGQIIVDEYGQSISHSDVYAAGDCAIPSPINDIEVRMSCQSAIPQGVHIAEVITARLHGRQPKPFAMHFSAQCISLGRRDALLQLTHPDDTPARFFTGRIAAIAKEMICRFTLISILAERYAHLYTWPGRNAQPQAQHAPAR